MLIVQQRPVKKRKPLVVNQFLKGTVNHQDFTANVFSIERKDGKWRMSGRKLVNLTEHKIQLYIPESYSKGVYKVEDHPNIVITYSTLDLLEPILKYVGTGLLDLEEVDPDNGHVKGALANGITRDDGDGPVYGMEFLFSLKG